MVDRQVDLICHAYKVHPASVIQTMRDSQDLAKLCNYELAVEMLSYFVGLVMGRWDVSHLATSQLGDTHNGNVVEMHLPRQPTGAMLTDNLDANELAIDAKGNGITGVFVDDPQHERDIVRVVNDAASIVWDNDALQSVEDEVCEIIGARDLRSYFRQQNATGFWQSHISRYSKSRRKAPIYWQLSTPSASYSVWLYYHRFTRDTFFQILNEYVRPKLGNERQKLERQQGESGSEPTRSQRKEIEDQEKFVAELAAMVEEVERIAPLWNPNRNDGVIINFAPLWRLVPQNKSWQKECKKVWDKLVKGEYDWAHLAMHLWPERVVPKCVTDASLAITHGLEEVFLEQDDRDRFQPKEEPEGGWEPIIQKLVDERTSPAVKAALESLLTAPAPAGNSKSRRRKATT